MKIFLVSFALFALLLSSGVQGTIVREGCLSAYQVCRPSANGAPGGISAHGAPLCYLQTEKLHEGKPCPDNPKGVRLFNSTLS